MAKAPTPSFHLSTYFKRTDAQPNKPRQPYVFLGLKNLPSNIKYVGEQVEINGTPGGNTQVGSRTHLNQPQCFSSCPCEAFSSDPPA